MAVRICHGADKVGSNLVRTLANALLSVAQSARWPGSVPHPLLLTPCINPPISSGFFFFFVCVCVRAYVTVTLFSRAQIYGSSVDFRWFVRELFVAYCLISKEYHLLRGNKEKNNIPNYITDLLTSSNLLFDMIMIC